MKTVLKLKPSFWATLNLKVIAIMHSRLSILSILYFFTRTRIGLLKWIASIEWPRLDFCFIPFSHCFTNRAKWNFWNVLPIIWTNKEVDKHFHWDAAANSWDFVSGKLSVEAVAGTVPCRHYRILLDGCLSHASPLSSRHVSTVLICVDHICTAQCHSPAQACCPWNGPARPSHASMVMQPYSGQFHWVPTNWTIVWNWILKLVHYYCMGTLEQLVYSNVVHLIMIK